MYTFNVIGAPDDIQTRGRETSEEFPIDSATLRSNLSEFCQAFSGVIDNIDSDSKSYSIEEITIKVQLGAKGKVNLLAIGSEISGSAGIDIKFKKQ